MITHNLICRVDEPYDITKYFKGFELIWLIFNFVYNCGNVAKYIEEHIQQILYAKEKQAKHLF